MSVKAGGSSHIRWSAGDNEMVEMNGQGVVVVVGAGGSHTLYPLENKHAEAVHLGLSGSQAEQKKKKTRKKH